jgi:RNA polymerase sigma-70 factor (ECF subfamily)
MKAHFESVSGLQMNIELDKEQQLIRQILEGDEAALRELVELYSDPLYAYLFHLLDANRQDTDDVWQEVWSAMLKALPSFRGDSRFFTWLCAIARRKVADHYRRPQQSTIVEQDVETYENLPDQAEQPEEWIVRRETRLCVVQALAALPIAYRTVLQLRYGDGCSVEETSRRMNVTYKAAESLLSRAREAFRRALSQTKMEDEND